jgi:hypothetical protein
MRSTVRLESPVAAAIDGMAGHASSWPVCSKMPRLKPRSRLRPMSSATLNALPGNGLPFGSLACFTALNQADLSCSNAPLLLGSVRSRPFDLVSLSSGQAARLPLCIVMFNASSRWI